MHDEHQHHPPHRRKLHHDWRTWVVVGLMLAGIATYVLTLDNSFTPGRAPAGARRPRVPPVRVDTPVRRGSN